MINSEASDGTSSPEETPLNTDSVTTTTGTPNYQISTAARTLKQTLDDLNMSLRRLSSYADRIQPVLMKLNSEAWQLRRAPIPCYWLEECLFFHPGFLLLLMFWSMKQYLLDYFCSDYEDKEKNSNDLTTSIIEKKNKNKNRNKKNKQLWIFFKKSISNRPQKQ